MSKCGLRVAAGGERDAKVLQKVPKRCQKHVPGQPGACLLSTLGSKRAPSQNIGIYCVKPTFAFPGGLLLGTPGNRSDVDAALTTNMCAKVDAKGAPGGCWREPTAAGARCGVVEKAHFCT